MEQRHKTTLLRLRAELASEICANSLVQHLYQTEILTAHQRDDVLAERTPQQRSLRLLDVLPQRGPRAFAEFLNALRGDYSWLVDMITCAEKAVVEEEGTRGDPLDYLAAHFPPDLLNSPPSEQQLGRLAASLGPECHHLVSILGVTQAQVYRCQVAHPSNAFSQVLAMLLAWRNGAGGEATRLRLCVAMKQAEVDLSNVFLLFQ